jgi:metal-responsive CopG/Arc/MetJ family transcriptional regulator
MASKAKIIAAVEDSAKSARASVSFPPELYAEVERIAQEKKVSVAWVVRDAVEKYVAERYPLFGRQ